MIVAVPSPTSIKLPSWSTSITLLLELVQTRVLSVAVAGATTAVSE